MQDQKKAYTEPTLEKHEQLVDVTEQELSTVTP